MGELCGEVSDLDVVQAGLHGDLVCVLVELDEADDDLGVDAGVPVAVAGHQRVLPIIASSFAMAARCCGLGSLAGLVGGTGSFSGLDLRRPSKPAWSPGRESIPEVAGLDELDVELVSTVEPTQDLLTLLRCQTGPQLGEANEASLAVFVVFDGHARAYTMCGVRE
jgi:hypothetical protein